MRAFIIRPFGTQKDIDFDAVEGLRVVGRAQFDLQAFEGSRVTWEETKNALPGTRLGKR